MIIAIDIRSLSGGAYTGVGEYTRNLLQHLIPAHSDIEFKLFFNAHSEKPNLDFLGAIPNAKLYHFRYPNKYFSAATRFLNVPKLDRMVGGADVFFSPHFIATPTTASCRKVITFHDLSFERYPEFFDRRRKFWHFSNNPKKQAQMASEIIAVSESTAYDLTDLYGVDAKKIHVVYSGVRKEFFREISQEEMSHVKGKYRLPDCFILSVSTIEPRKNVLGIIKAFEIFKECPDVKAIYFLSRIYRRRGQAGSV
ncbi:MAG: glycosyltransferase [Candidatus Spechtbacteria bacterium]|nr:glycosyltransferase [Candidatus Spechtbacteria bacterium]